jgi:hypothetical protein
LLVRLRGHVPGFGAGDGADGGLEAEGQLGFRVVGVRGGDDGFWVVKCNGMGWDSLVERLTSAAPLTYWAWPPMREGCCCWSDMVVWFCVGFGEVVGI